MSQENVELVGRMTEAYARGDADTHRFNSTVWVYGPRTRVTVPHKALGMHRFGVELCIHPEAWGGR